jgi:hypothetical protein
MKVEGTGARRTPAVAVIAPRDVPAGEPPQAGAGAADSQIWSLVPGPHPGACGEPWV